MTGQLPQATTEAIRTRRKQGRPLKAIAAELGLSVTTVAKYTHGMTPPRTPDITAEQHQEIRQRYTAGETVNTIASAFNITPTTVNRHLAGVPRRPDAHIPLTPEKIETIRQLCREGRAPATIARDLGISQSTVRNHARDILGPTRRPPRTYPPITPAMDRDIKRRYLQGQGPNSIARKLGIPLSAVNRHVADLPNQLKTLSPETRNEIKTLYTAGHDTRHIADKLNLPKSTVRHYKHDRNNRPTPQQTRQT
jgi:DNA-binding NarL/FixJ family response regulator